MKVLFLDIDGVCNCKTTTNKSKGFIGIDPVMAFRVGKIVVDTGCEVVLSSSWRHFKDGRKEVDQKVYKTVDITPDDPKGFRGNEIKTWLDLHPEVTKYAILDDDSDFHPDQILFKTTWETGLTDEIAAAVTAHLNAGDQDCAGYCCTAYPKRKPKEVPNG